MPPPIWSAYLIGAPLCLTKGLKNTAKTRPSECAIVKRTFLLLKKWTLVCVLVWFIKSGDMDKGPMMNVVFETGNGDLVVLAFNAVGD
uniref:Uncharacterized protein n=1 Tax=Oryza punctata TaxID=4537 RepID=A0A0E0LVB7_ORYPU